MLFSFWLYLHGQICTSGTTSVHKLMKDCPVLFFSKATLYILSRYPVSIFRAAIGIATVECITT